MRSKSHKGMIARRYWLGYVASLLVEGFLIFKWLLTQQTRYQIEVSSDVLAHPLLSIEIAAVVIWLALRFYKATEVLETSYNWTEAHMGLMYLCWGLVYTWIFVYRFLKLIGNVIRMAFQFIWKHIKIALRNTFSRQIKY